jgi:hypothetical protein
MVGVPEPLADGLNGFSASFDVTSSLGDEQYWTLWDGEFEATEGITGLWFPTEGLMVLERRGLTHHNGAYRQVHDRLGPLSPVMPGASGSSSGSRFLDLPSSGGGLYQILSRLDVTDDVERWNSGSFVSPEDIWAVVYAARLVDAPGGTLVTANYDRRGIASADPNYSEQSRFTLADAYTELQFSPAGKPEPRIDRGLEE